MSHAQRIALLTHEFAPFRGGIATYTHEIAREASRLGHQVTVVAPTFATKDVGDAADASDGERGYAVRRFTGGRYSARRFPRVLAIAARELLRRDVDIVHGVEWPFAIALGLLPRPTGVRTVATFHGSEILRNRRMLAPRWSPVAAAISRIDRITVNSEFTGSLLFDVVPERTRDRVRVTPLGVSAPDLVPERLPDVRAALEIDPGATMLLTVGRLDPRKGQLSMVQALRRLSAQDRQNVHYVIAGATDDASYVARLREEIERCPVPVHLLDRVDDLTLEALYRSSTWFCMPAQLGRDRVEGFGLVFLEAALRGLPSIATRVGAIPEVIVHGETGLLANTPDPADFSAALGTALAHPELRQELSRRAEARARTFAWSRTAELTYDGL